MKSEKLNSRGLIIGIAYFSLLVFHFSHVKAQKHKIDSLHNVLKMQKDDTARVSTLDHLSYQFGKMGDYDSSLYYAVIEQDLSEKIKFTGGLGNAYKNIGDNYWSMGNYPKALDYEFKALAIVKSQGNKKGISAIEVEIGNVYWSQSNYKGALEYYLNALTIDHEIGDKNGMAADYDNIGLVYADQANYVKALEYMFKSLEIEKEIGNTDGIANTLGNIGNAYDVQGNFQQALEYELKALAIFHKVGNKEGIAHNYANIGCVFIEMKKYPEAKIYLDSALVLSKQIGEVYDMRSTYNYLATLDSATGDYKTAYNNYKKYIFYRDSLVNEANTKKTVQAEMNFQFEQKQAAEKAEQAKKDAVAEQDKNKQAIVRNSFIVGFVLMLTLAFFIFRGLRQKQKANEIITRQKEEVENQILLPQ